MNLTPSQQAEGLKRLQGLTPAQVKSAYSGRPGCACGCRGKYHAAGQQVTRILNLIKAAAPQGIAADSDQGGLTYLPGHYLALDTDTRTYIVYF